MVESLNDNIKQMLLEEGYVGNLVARFADIGDMTDERWVDPSVPRDHSNDEMLAKRMQVSVEECAALADSSGAEYLNILNNRKEKTNKESYWLGKAGKK